MHPLESRAGSAILPVVGDIGPMEIILLLLVALLLFGAERLPEIGRSVGQGVREFKDSLSGERDE